MDLIVIRHASTTLYEQGLINGAIDEDLSSTGLAQINQIIELLSGYDFDVIYSSAMKRSVQTAGPIASHYNVPLRQDARIGEVNLGSFNGKEWDSTVASFGSNSSTVLSSCSYDFKPYGGESSTEVEARIRDFLKDLRTYKHTRPLIVTHGGIIRWLNYSLKGEKLGRVGNLGVHQFKLGDNE